MGRKTPNPPSTRGISLLGRHDFFTRFAKRAARATGQPFSFLLGAGIIIVWAVTGPLFHFSDTGSW